MEEAERLCDRVGIIDHGRLVVEGTRRQLVGLVGQRDRVRLQVEGDTAAVAAALAAHSDVADAVAANQEVELYVGQAGERLPELLAVATRDGAVVTGVDVTEPDLESVFLHVTGRALRDG
jgi:ABC-2 type transport system ATP-binding protein